MRKKILFLIIILLTLIVYPNPIFAQSEVESSSSFQTETLEAKVIKILEEKDHFQKLELQINIGSRKGETVIVENGGGEVESVYIPMYKEGDQVVLMRQSSDNNQEIFYITDYVRRSPLFWLVLFFLVIVLVVGKWRGLSSLFGLGLTFFVILMFIVPQIASGRDPVFITIVGSLLILPLTFYLSHGINKKTHIALLGTFIAVIMTGILSGLFIYFGKLTGYFSEEVGILSALKAGSINMQGLLLSGIIIGTLGVLDDITISQAAIVMQLYEISVGKVRFQEIFKRAMEVGKDHIASMINTLFLVYTGASLPLLLLFTNNPRPFLELINYEPIATEIIRTLVGSIGLIMAVPITTLISIYFMKRNTLYLDKTKYRS
ncbi:hypothetical protein A2X44_04700 [candidate division CPR3 bacterium GWF2_35_18]|uniref:YibE/F family protein n=1 Tax=candidate division CPR3 bacterium GW2011_GWF2_35_18 TaxID=1618350 RepID=A0A0G0BJT3_UNCC3|nr:MAG: hypothetical protein UR67_C0003G0022 [candidate division CPR3 bacterium GW2011_GWF2_35_18]KKP86208.1 MAG: hypothetical protein UR87_C0026G0010 [candidate division CPR3 bacterium GW2011_GWE2_35_7]OGB63633.1 MAG: hypothetical protein A2X44_04700 [candidate division CPR3 bacterium GWF2_35_18]OGB64172.1 MAG: hypothetical protein A2250_02545 [candidate division CPR3 bacterium RIFOXYA2_FULL_35_13]OGB80242.1 MAG: hypothetical protein A2011_01255 [candidate division CPR3 bacterium GWE2_35_7]